MNFARVTTIRWKVNDTLIQRFYEIQRANDHKCLNVPQCSLMIST